jgi:molybdopterin molybdotransferase
MAQLSADCFAHGGRLMSLAEALALIEERSETVAPIEAAPLRESLSRILAEDVIAPFAVPPCANSAVDGYALRFEDLPEEGETALRVVGRAAAGHPERRARSSGASRRRPC